jgi:hypothetical protein
MNILVVGFQRSGTTLLRRLLQLHPQVRRIYHENFLLKICKDKQTLIQFVENRGIDVTKDNWGEKVPYFPSARKFPIIKYCEKWNKFFNSKSRILHIIRHPYDVAVSNVNKFKYIKNLEQPIRTYKGIVPVATKKIMKMNNTYTFKYEDLLINPDDMLFKIYKHCGLKPDINFRKKMRTIKNRKYQKIDPSRAFAYKKEQKLNFDFDLDCVFDILNEIDGVKYDK